MSIVADSLPSARSLRRGVLLGLAAGAVASAVWYLVVLGTSSMQTYLIPGIGVVVSYGVYAGMRTPGRLAAVVSVAITALAVMVAMFYVERHLIINWFHENHDAKQIPIFPYLDWMASVLRHALGKSLSSPVYSLLALVAAGWFGHQGFESHDPSARRG